MRRSLLSGRTWLMAVVAATKDRLAVRDTHIVTLTPEARMPPAFFLKIVLLYRVGDETRGGRFESGYLW